MLFKAIGLNMIQKRGKMDGKLWDIPQFGYLEGDLNLTRRLKTEMGGEERERIDPKATCRTGFKKEIIHCKLCYIDQGRSDTEQG